MTSVIDNLRVRARAKNARVVFPEIEDPRVQEAIQEFQSQGFGQAVVIDPSADIKLPQAVLKYSRQDRSLFDVVTDDYRQKRLARGIAKEAVETELLNPLLFAALVVAKGLAEASVAGSLATTADVLRAAIRGVGAKPGRKLVSSFFLMELQDGSTVTYSDCGVVPDPNAEELAEIAVAAAESHKLLTGDQARVAMLSFSTMGSAKHPRVDKVREATSLARKMAPDLTIDGEMQFDAAFVPEIAERKARTSSVAGRANVFIFPDLDSGNIAYKITERLAGATALGPLIQGLAKPCMDLSRGCKASDIVDVAVIAACLA